jgi:hypothetical protein
VKRYGKYGRNPRLNSEKIWKIWKKGKLNSEKIWKIWKKSRVHSEKIFLPYFPNLFTIQPGGSSIFSISFHYSTWVSSIFSISRRQTSRSHYGSKVSTVTVTIFKYRNKIGKIIVKDMENMEFFHIFHIFSLFNLLFFHNCHIFSLFLRSGHSCFQ